MKQLSILISLLLIVTLGMNAQNNKRTSAYMYLQNNQLDKAKEAIDEAAVHEKTSMDPKTWLYRGEIYYQLATGLLPMYNDLAPDAANVAYESLKNARKFDEKGRYEDEINMYLNNLVQVYYQQGGTDFQDGNYEESIDDFKKAFEISQMNNQFDTIAAFNIGMAGVLSDNPQVASEYLAKCVEVNFDDPRVYLFYNRSVKQLGDTALAFKIVEQGRERYPDELTLLLEQAQLYLETDQKEKLLASLKQAIDEDPTNSNLYFLIGKTYDDKKVYDTAEIYYKKAAEVNPQFFEAYYNIGAIYVNQAAETQGMANDLPLNETDKYKELTDKAAEYLEQAVPYLEKALEIKPEDQPTIHALKESYARLKMDDKLEKLNNK
jgi:tetratricopeptide (TPR) repeat protein